MTYNILFDLTKEKKILINQVLIQKKNKFIYKNYKIKLKERHKYILKQHIDILNNLAITVKF